MKPRFPAQRRLRPATPHRRISEAVFADASDDHDEEPIIFGPAEEVVSRQQRR